VDGHELFAYKLSMAKKSKDDLPQDLETALKALEKAVEELEKPELSLEKSIELFEEGTKLSDVCYSRLKEAETKVEILLKKIPNPDSREDFQVEDFNAD